jgi:hypothetical protein
MVPQSRRSPNLGNFGPGQKAIWMWALWRDAEYTIKREGGGFPQVRAVVSLMCLCCPWLVLSPKVFQQCTNHLALVLCKVRVSEWSLSTLPNPILELQHAPLPLKLLWAREHVPTPSSVVFYLDSHLSFSRSWECVRKLLKVF